MRADTDIAVSQTSELGACIDRLVESGRSASPLSTYRLQFNYRFRFQDGLELLPYLEALGVSHVYSSPILKARTHSLHGYDITDHNVVNPEIGGEEELYRFSHALKQRGMGLVLDTVPNHMGVGHGDNPWWQDVLENGRAAEHSDFFDIDWRPLKTELRDKVLLPVLGDQYGAELESGRITLEFTGEHFQLRYYDRVLPLDPQTLPLFFSGEAEVRRFQKLSETLEALASLPAHDVWDAALVARRREQAPRLEAQLCEIITASPEVMALVERLRQRINGNPGEARSFDRLHHLLEAQAYRLAHWRVSAEEINYRRFFDVNDLVGLRMENPAVFAATHGLLRKLLADGVVEGLRVDHPDGMLNPRQHFTRLQMLYCASQCGGPTPHPPVADNGIEIDVQTAFGQHEGARLRPPLYCVVEKILEPGEELPEEWPVDGSSGYDFANLLNGLLIQGQNERAFTQIYQRFTGETADFEAQLYSAKKAIMHTALSGEVNVLAHLLDELSGGDRRARDFTRKALRDAIREAIACFPVYRTYIDERGEINERDRTTIAYAILRAKRRNAGTATAVFDFLRGILLLERGNDHGLKLQFTLKFQQLTGPIMAKGLEDTVCYTFNRFVSLNEVGGSPRRFGIGLDDFHRDNAHRARHWPASMLATSTHDTKRSEDVRARLNVLSEMPREWSQHVMRWRRSNHGRKRTLPDGRRAPDANEEYLLYQTLVGAWPLEAMDDGQTREDFIRRIGDTMEKCLHEAKANLSWINPDPEYVEAVRSFVRAILSPGPRGRMSFFLKDFSKLLAPVKFFGAVNSLAQTVLKLMAPGVPDLYQGCELFNLRLVDPDNRSPVDFDLRRELLARMKQLPVTAETAAALMQEFDNSDVKMWVTMLCLGLRRQFPAVFRGGAYLPLHAAGERRENVCAFARQTGRSMITVAVPRFSYTLMKGRPQAALGEAWGDTEILLPPDAPNVMENIFTGERLQVSERKTLRCADVFSTFPVAVLQPAD